VLVCGAMPVAMWGLDTTRTEFRLPSEPLRRFRQRMRSPSSYNTSEAVWLSSLNQ
jgi:hypothetical protein